MLRIALLDDNHECLKSIERVLRHYFLKKFVEVEIKLYSQVDFFLMELLDSEYFDIYLLDIEMPQMTGIEVAKKIRDLFPEPYIIYVTDYLNYAIEAYEVNTFRYIPKNLLEKNLPSAMDILVEYMENKIKKVYTIKTADRIEQIEYRNIYYMKKEGKYVVIHHNCGDSKVRAALKDVFINLAAEEFLYVDKSYVINMQHIISLKQKEILLRNGVLLPVSKPRLQTVKESIYAYGRIR